MIKKGIYAASLSVLNENGTLNINETILHAESTIKNGLHGIFFFGSTGQSQLISVSEKVQLINSLIKSKYKKKYIIGTGFNSLIETINFMKVANSLKTLKGVSILAAFKCPDIALLDFFSGKNPICKAE